MQSSLESLPSQVNKKPQGRDLASSVFSQGRPFYLIYSICTVLAMNASIVYRYKTYKEISNLDFFGFNIV